MYYFEQKTFAGEWVPVKADAEPTIAQVNGRSHLKKPEGIGPVVRSVRSVPGYYRHLNLDQLQAVMSPDGKFRSQTRN